MSKVSEARGGLSIVVPAFNEAGAISTVLKSVREAFPDAEIIVVDDCSIDDTGAIAASIAEVRVIRHVFNCGQGAALKTGMTSATREYVAWFDADNEHRVEDLRTMYKCALENRLVAVIGQRTSGSATLTRAVGKGLIRTFGRGLGIRAGSDLNCGLRVFRRDIILRYLPLIPNRFSSSLVTTLIMLERRYPLKFVPIVTNQRIGHSTVHLKDGFEAALQLIRAVLLFAPIRFFLPLGSFLTVVGTLYSLVMAAFFGRGIPVGGMFLVLSGILTSMLGLIADQISQMRLSLLDGSAPSEAFVQLALEAPASAANPKVQVGQITTRDSGAL